MSVRLLEFTQFPENLPVWINPSEVVSVHEIKQSRGRHTIVSLASGRAFTVTGNVGSVATQLAGPAPEDML